MKMTGYGFTVGIWVEGDGIVAEQLNQIAFEEIDLMFTAG